MYVRHHLRLAAHEIICVVERGRDDWSEGQVAEVEIQSLCASESQIEKERVERYVQLETAPPPIDVVIFRQCAVIVQGHHRTEAALLLGKKKIVAIVRQLSGQAIVDRYVTPRQP